MSPTIVRGTIVSFDTTSYTATVMLDGSLAEVTMPVGEWVPASFLAADDSVAVLLFQAHNYENGVILGPFGAASALLALTGTPTDGQVPIGRTAQGDLVLASLTGTANQITVTGGAGAITLSLPSPLSLTDLNLAGSVLSSVPIGAHVTHNANQSIGNGGSGTVVAFNTERWDTAGLHDPATNNSRLTCPVAGKYLIQGSVTFATNGTGRRRALIQLNGSALIARWDSVTAGGTDVTVCNVQTIWDMAQGDYVELVAFQNSGGGLNVLATADYSPSFMMVRLP